MYSGDIITARRIEYSKGSVISVNRSTAKSIIVRKLRLAADRIGGAAELNALRPFFMTVNGTDGITVSGKVTVTEYSDTQISLFSGDVSLVLRGEQLKISVHTAENTSVNGTVRAILFE